MNLCTSSKIALATVWIASAVSSEAQDALLNKIVHAIGEVETGNLKGQARLLAQRGHCHGWYMMSEDLWYDTTIYRFKKGQQVYHYKYVSDEFCARAYCKSALEMLCTRWHAIFGCYPTIRDLANCYREGLAATIRGQIRKGKYAERVENLVMKETK